ncbi:hypothetical protein ABVK25_012437 [Lepraria finkii]|uniref:EF-hand domain-containing protein n=1 Tax=Lepraria finkii TaxID=1340010 RepID=A0ABR4AHD2_9LECA
MCVGQFVDKDDKDGNRKLRGDEFERRVKDLEGMDHADEDDLEAGMNEIKSNLEKLFTSGQVKMVKRKPRPDDWDSDLQGDWDNDPLAVIQSDEDVPIDSDEAPKPVKPVAKGTGKRAAATTKAAAPAKNSRGRKKVVDESEGDDDVVMVDSEEDQSQGLFVKPAPAPRKTTTAARSTRQTSKPTSKPAAAPPKQSQLNFSQPKPRAAKSKAPVPISDDDISDDDDDAFEPMSTAKSTRSRRS